MENVCLFFHLLKILKIFNENLGQKNLFSHPHRTTLNMENNDFGTLLNALKAIDAESTHVLNRGLATKTFFFGLINLLVSAYLVGAFTESFWIVYAAQAFLIIGYRIYVDAQKTNPITLLYFLDFCWVANFVLSLTAGFLLLQVMDDTFDPSMNYIPDFDIAKEYPNLGRTFVLLSTGPLGWSVIALSNALVLHDIELYSGCFIHLWPALTTLSVRWDHGERVMATYPGHFDGLAGFHDKETPLSYVQLVSLGMTAYMVWWIPFTIWMLVHGRFQSHERTNKTTVYLNLVKTNGAVRNVIGVHGTNGRLLDQASEVGPVIKYMLAHCVLCCLSFCFSALAYQYILLHACFCVVLVIVALLNASKRYKWMLTQRYVRAMEKHAMKLFPEKKDVIKQRHKKMGIINGSSSKHAMVTRSKRGAAATKDKLMKKDT